MAEEALQAVGPPAHKAGASPLNGVVPPPEYRWKPGQTGNPTGGWEKGPPGPSLRRALTKLISENPERAERIVEAIAAAAEAGDIKAAALLWDREDGKAVQAIKHSGSVTSVNIAGVEDNSP